MFGSRKEFLFRKGFVAFLVGMLWSGTIILPVEKPVSMGYQQILLNRKAAVVQIQLIQPRNVTYRSKYFEDFFLPENQQTRQNEMLDESKLGSGFIFREDGYIVTARHLLEGVDEVLVVLPDGAYLPARVVGSELRSQVAVLKVEAINLPAISLEDVGELRVGRLGFAIGSPRALEFSNTVTQGIISAIPAAESDHRYALTDAAMNPGSSGGPLIGSEGELLGMALVPYERRQNESGLFAIVPASNIRDAVDRILEREEVGRVRLGVQFSPAFDAGKQSQGAARIVEVEPGSSAQEAGLKQGDVILAINGASLMDHLTLFETIEQQAPGDVITLTIKRGTDAIDMQIRLKALAKRTKKGVLDQRKQRGMMGRLGIMLDDLTPQLARDLDLSVEQGVVVLYADPASRAYLMSDIRSGMVITELAGQETHSKADFELIMDSFTTGSIQFIKLIRPGLKGSVLSALEIPEK